MKVNRHVRLLIKTGILVGALASSLAWGGASFTYCDSTNSGSGGTSSQTCGAFTLGPHQAIFYVQTWPSSVSTVTLSDTNSFLTFHTYTSTTFTDGAITRTVLVGCAYNTSGNTTDTINISYSANSTFAQFQGAQETDTTFTSCTTALNSAGSGLGVGTGSGTGTGTVSTSAATSTVAGVSIIGACDGNTGATNYSAGSGFTQWVITPSPQIKGEDEVGVSVGSQTATCNFTASANWAIVMALVCDGDCTAASRGFAAVY